MAEIISKDAAFAELANAIIIRACQDYLDNDKHISRESIERFFQSDWFSMLSRNTISGNAIICHLKTKLSVGQDGSAVYYRVKEKAGNGKKELRWNLSESAKGR